MLPKQDPSFSSRNEKPPLESRRVRIQPWIFACLPIASSLRASATLRLCIASPCCVFCVLLSAFLMHALGRQPAFGVECRHATRSSRGDRLSVVVVGNVS